MSKKITMSAKNKAFWELSPEKQRVAVAKDVLKQIDDKFLIPTSDSYLYIKSREEMDLDHKQLNEVLNIFKRNREQCSVCGIGACFVSLVVMGNNILAADAFETKTFNGADCIGSRQMRPLLRKVFSSHQLSLIECAFEQSPLFIDGNRLVSCWDDREKASDFGSKYMDSKKRLVAIMKNIIKNKGTFIP